jgi:D-glycero-D-manno-heptose 1,7-bisphosphate phosphatase
LISDKAIFLDRDGVINLLIKNGDKYRSPRNLLEFEINPNFPNFITTISKYFQFYFVVTNQPDISRKSLTLKNLDEMHNYIISNVFKFDSILYCPHLEIVNCECRKPKINLFQSIESNYIFNKSKSWMIGDRWTDIQAGKRFGLKTALLQTPNSFDGANFFTKMKNSPTVQADNLTDLGNLIVKNL